MREEIAASDRVGNKKGIEEKRCAHLEELDGVFTELPYSIVQKKQKRRFHECSKIRIRESISLKAFEHRNPFSLLENNQEEDLVNFKKRLENNKVIQEMKKSQLKKCRSCNAKKRTCFILQIVMELNILDHAKLSKTS